VKLLHPAGNAHGPPAVTKVPLQLAEDRRRRERREQHAPSGIESLNGFEQPDERDLAEVIDGLAAVREATSEMLCKADVLFDERVPQLDRRMPTVLDEARQHLVVVALRRRVMSVASRVTEQNAVRIGSGVR